MYMEFILLRAGVNCELYWTWYKTFSICKRPGISQETITVRRRIFLIDIGSDLGSLCVCCAW